MAIPRTPYVNIPHICKVNYMFLLSKISCIFYSYLLIKFQTRTLILHWWIAIVINGPIKLQNWIDLMEAL